VEIERRHEKDGARLAAESHSAAIDRIQAIVRKERIQCDFDRLDGYLFLGPNDSVELLDAELAAAHRAGLTQVTKLPRAPLDSFDTGPCLRFPNQGQFHPLKYLARLATAITRNNGHIFTNTHVDRIDGGDRAEVKAAGHVVTADAVVVATNSPINDLLAIHTKQAPYISYVIGARIPVDSVTKALYWDTPDPYHYVRLQSARKGRGRASGTNGHDLLIVGGEDHKSGQADDTEERHGRLESWARERFPMMEEIEFTWAGQVMETVDGLAFIGRNPLDKDNVFIATGDSGHGMTHGTIAGMLITDLVLGRPNPWAQLYDPSRRTLRAAAEYASELAKSNLPFGEWLTPGEVDSIDDVPPGEGRIIRHGLQKLAVYRDAAGGKVVSLSARCPHLGCVVEWNGSEKTWDCPCHGSRYAPDGRVLNGPALSDLSPVAQPELARRQ